MDTANTIFSSEGTVLMPQQIGKIGNIPIFAYPGVDIPLVEEPTGTDNHLEIERPVICEDINVLELAKKYYEEHKHLLLKKYRGKYIAILNNKIVGSGKDFSLLARRVYKKYGYQTMYMPFVNVKEKIVRIPSPRVKVS